MGSQQPKSYRQQDQVQSQIHEVSGPVRQQREWNEEQGMICRTNKRQRAFVTSDQHILKLLLRPVIVEFAGVPRSDHVAGGVELSEVGVPMQCAGEQREPSQKLHCEKNRRNSQKKIREVTHATGLRGGFCRHANWTNSACSVGRFKGTPDLCSP